MKQAIIPISRFNQGKFYENNLQSIRKLLMDIPYYQKILTPYVFLKLNTDDKTYFLQNKKINLGEDKGWIYHG